MPIRMILVLMLSLLVPPAFGQTYDDMDIADLRMRAEQGDVIAQSQLGYRYRIGQGCSSRLYPGTHVDEPIRVKQYGSVKKQCRQTA